MSNGNGIGNGASKPLGVGDLPVAVAISDTDTIPICQAANGCFANDTTVTLHGAKQSQLVSYYRARFFAVAPITYDGNGSFGLAIDPTTLAVVNGKLTVIGGVTPPPSGTGGPVVGGGGGVVTGGGGAPVTGGGTGAAATGPGVPAVGGGDAPVTGGGGAPVVGGGQEAALMQRINELEARLAALEELQ